MTSLGFASRHHPIDVAARERAHVLGAVSRQQERSFRGGVFGRTRAVGHDPTRSCLLDERRRVPFDFNDRGIHRAGDMAEVERRSASHVDDQDLPG